MLDYGIGWFGGDANSGLYRIAYNTGSEFLVFTGGAGALLDVDEFTFAGTPPTSTNLALNKPATALSAESDAFPASAAVDGSATTRWSSAFADPQWIQVDLGQSYALDRVRLVWEAAYGSAYQIQTSANGSTWTTVRLVTAGNGGEDDHTALGATGRYVHRQGYRLGIFAVHLRGLRQVS